jgi:phosphoribosylformimino-5-aminoimidazole carboxamide ribotide isomerase
MTDATFEILPAIDLLGARVVRLQQGDFGRAATFSDDPIMTARELAEQGTGWLHIVDLDGARQGKPVQSELIRSIVTSVAPTVSCQIAGGLRSRLAVDMAIAFGAARVVLGTAVLRDPGFACEIVSAHGAQAVVAAIDVRSDMALGYGWQQGTEGVAAEAALLALADVGVERFAVTAIERDGLLVGPDLELLRTMVRLDRGSIMASGGISSLDDLRAVRDVGCAGAIVGRALYEGRIDLAEARSALN